MLAIKGSLEVFDKFISVAKEIAKLPALVLPQYRDAAQDLYEISQKLLKANENISRWLFLFMYFDFKPPEARSKFLTLVQKYKTMKQGPEFSQLKFSCSDISHIYFRNIQSKLGGWFTKKDKREAVEGIFTSLTDVDDDMVAFVYEYVVGKLEDGISLMENHVEAGAVNDAELVRLEMKADMKKITESLEKFSGELSDLTIRFARIARVPITL